MGLRKPQEALQDDGQVIWGKQLGNMREFTKVGNLREVCLEGRRLAELSTRRENSPVLWLNQIFEWVVKVDKSQSIKKSVLRFSYMKMEEATLVNKEHSATEMFRKSLDDRLAS